jgi:hypothetical protein
MIANNQSKGSINGMKQPYSRTDFWMKPENQFWNNKQPGSLFSYNTEAYEKILRGWIKNEKNISILNLGK